MGSDPRSQATAMSACAPGQPMVRTESSGWLRKNTGNSRSDEELPNKVQKKRNEPKHIFEGEMFPFRLFLPETKKLHHGGEF